MNAFHDEFEVEFAKSLHVINTAQTIVELDNEYEHAKAWIAAIPGGLTMQETIAAQRMKKGLYVELSTDWYKRTTALGYVVTFNVADFVPPGI